LYFRLSDIKLMNTSTINPPISRLFPKLRQYLYPASNDSNATFESTAATYKLLSDWFVRITAVVALIVFLLRAKNMP